MKVRLSDSARSHLLQEAAYLRKHNLEAAKAFIEDMRLARRNLSLFKNLGFVRQAPPVPGIHRLVVGQYLLDYEIGDAGIDILAIRHGQQREPVVEIDEDYDFEADPPASQER